MLYSDSIAWLYSTQSAGIKLGLENITRLLSLLGVDPRRPAAACFHVAGTNGKGSVCAMLDAICRAQGLRSGLFTSPHLVTFRERIRINGELIPEAEVAAGLTRIRTLTEGWEYHPTFFEITTALALDWFRRQNLDVIVLETGLGGRLDSTNAVTPSVSILTPISFDHRQYLGDTLEQIAGEKAGILKPGVPAVSAPQPPEAARIFRETAARVGAPLTEVAVPVEFEVALPGSHQKLNAALAIAALRAAGLSVSEEAIKAGLRDVQWPGRFQRIAGLAGTPLVLDGAHNDAAAERLVETWREVYGSQQPVVLLAALQDKDVAAICARLAPLAAEFVVTQVQNSRSCTGSALAQAVRNAAPARACQIAESVQVGLATAEAAALSRGCPVLVTGSLFLIGETLALLEGTRSEVSAQ